MINYKFLEDNKSKLIDIYRNERFVVNKNQEGALMIDYRINDKVDVFYWTTSAMSDNIRELYLEEVKKNNLLSKTNLVYLILLDHSETKVLTYQI